MCPWNSERLLLQIDSQLSTWAPPPCTVAQSLDATKKEEVFLFLFFFYSSPPHGLPAANARRPTDGTVVSWRCVAVTVLTQAMAASAAAPSPSTVSPVAPPSPPSPWRRPRQAPRRFALSPACGTAGRPRVSEGDGEKREKRWVGNLTNGHTILKKILLTGLPRVILKLWTARNSVQGVSCSVLKVRGERCLVFKFRSVIHTHLIVQGVIRTFLKKVNPSYESGHTYIQFYG